jgi:hypothetical protein
VEWAGEGAAAVEILSAHLKLCLVTAQRVGEVARMCKDELDLDRALRSLPAARTKNASPHAVPLSSLALALIGEALAEAGEAAFVFPCGSADDPRPLAPAAVAHTVPHGAKAGADHPAGRFGVTGWSAHDLRHTKLTGMAALGIAPIVLRSCWGMSPIIGRQRAPASRSRSTRNTPMSRRSAKRSIEAKSRRTGKPARTFKEFRWLTREGWSRERRVIAKAEFTKGEANPRFVVTSLRRAQCKPKYLYEKVYRARGEMENRIKECQLDLYADRTSTATMRANQLRLCSPRWPMCCSARLRGEFRRVSGEIDGEFCMP